MSFIGYARFIRTEIIKWHAYKNEMNLWNYVVLVQNILRTLAPHLIQPHYHIHTRTHARAQIQFHYNGSVRKLYVFVKMTINIILYFKNIGSFNSFTFSLFFAFCPVVANLLLVMKYVNIMYTCVVTELNQSSKKFDINFWFFFFLYGYL